MYLVTNAITDFANIKPFKIIWCAMPCFLVKGISILGATHSTKIMCSIFINNAKIPCTIFVDKRLFFVIVDIGKHISYTNSRRR